MLTKLHLSDIINPVLRTHLKQLATAIKKVGGVQDLENRLLTWINGDDLGSFVFSSYKDYGFYYIRVSRATYNPGNNKFSLDFKIQNLMTDQVVFQQTDLVFQSQEPQRAPHAPSPYESYYPERDPFNNQGFQWFQWPPNIVKGTLLCFIDNPNFLFPKMVIKQANQFNDVVINQTTGGGNVTIHPA